MSIKRAVPVKAGPGGWWTGWQRPLGELFAQVRAEIDGLKARIDHPVNAGRPACYVGSRLFRPEFGQTAIIDARQNSTSTNLVNFVAREQAYEIPVICSGPGVFVADFIKVHCHQRFRNPNYPEPVWLEMPPMEASFTGMSFTRKFSLHKNDLVVGPMLPRSCINYMWNLVDGANSRQLADDLMPNMLLMPRSYFENSFPQRHGLPDGNFFFFDVPWAFERDGQVNFTFRPVTPVVQFDSSIIGTAVEADGLAGGPDYPFDDREAGRRDQSVRVTVEIHGHRYLTDQDAIRTGALSLTP